MSIIIEGSSLQLPQAHTRGKHFKRILSSERALTVHNNKAKYLVKSSRGVNLSDASVQPQILLRNITA